MINKVLLTILFLIFYSESVYSFQEKRPLVKIKGIVLDESTKSTMPGTSVIIKDKFINNKQIGVATDLNGEFIMFISQPLPFILQFSHVGYQTFELEIRDLENIGLTITLLQNARLTDEVIILGEKLSQEELRIPITKDKINILELQQTPSFNIYDAVSNLRGVDVATQSLLISTVNTRGFNSTTNLRFSQFIDGIDNQAPGFNFPLSNIAGLSELDLESMELIPGPSTSLNGPGSFNGTLALTSKSPFDFQGLSMYTKVGVNELKEYGGKTFFDIGGNPVYDFGMRYAKASNNKIAWKVSASYLTAVDFKADDYQNIGPGKSFDIPADNPGINGLNIYGDEISARLPLGINDSIVTVTRTGYKEEDLVDYKIKNFKANAAIHYRLNDNTHAVIYGNYGIATTMFSGDNRIYLRDFSVLQWKAEIVNKKFTLRSYRTVQNSGNSYNTGLLATKMMRTAKPDDDWFTQFKNAYNGYPLARATNNYLKSREFADSGFGIGKNYQSFFEPGTVRFDSLKQNLIDKSNPNGASIYDRSGIFHMEGRYVITNNTNGPNFDAGLNYRLYTPKSNGTIFSDTINNTIRISEVGGYLKGTQAFNNNISLTGILRIDKNENFDPIINPSLMAVKTINKIHNIRASIQSGFRYPSVREQFSNQDLGDIRLIGGLSPIVSQYQLEGNTFTTQTVNRFNEAIEKDINYDPISNPDRLSRNQSEIKNLNILENNIVGSQFNTIKPERVTSLEIGYRSVFEGRRLIDFSYYRGSFKDFIGTVRLVKPRVSPQTDLLAAAQQVNNSAQRELIYVFANAQETVVAQGMEFTYNVTSVENFLFIFHFTWAELNKESDDPIIPAFNTPRFKFNFSFGHRRIVENFGFKVNWRLREEYYWESSFADGMIEPINTFDIQFNITMPKISTQLKVGANNLLNNRAPNTYGGPEISSLFYLNLIYDPFFFKRK